VTFAVQADVRQHDNRPTDQKLIKKLL
jgi:hypothetical protein